MYVNYFGGQLIAMWFIGQEQLAAVKVKQGY